LDTSSDATIEAWTQSDGDQTLQEFATHVLSDLPMMPRNPNRVLQR
jgi:hypothetical protein